MLKTTVLAIVAGYGGLLGVGRVAYRSILYPAPRRGLSPQSGAGQVRQFPTSDGHQVQCAIYQPVAEADATLVFFHGNGESIADSVALANEVVRRGLRFVAVEYRGYGTSPTEDPTEDGLYADAEGVVTGLLAEGIPNERMTLWGSSLGTGIAVEMSVRGHGDRLILQAPYTCIPDVAQRWLPILPMRVVIGDRYDNLAKAPRITQRTLVVHGDADAVVPYDMGVTVSQAIGDAELLTVDGGGHNDLFAREGPRLLDAIINHASR